MLQDYRSATPTREAQDDLALAQAQADTRQIYASTLAADTDRAFHVYETDGDTRHLNNFAARARQNPVGQSMWSQWLRFDPLTRTAQTEAWLGNMGITDLDEYFSNPELTKSKVIGTDSTGKQALLDMNQLYKATGYTQRAESRQLATLRSRAEIEKLMRGTQSAEGNMIAQIREEVPGRSWQEAMDIYYKAKNQGKVTGSAKERVAADLMAKNPSLTYEEALNQAAAHLANPTAASQDLQEADTIRAQLDEVAGGDFFAADMNDPAIRRRVGPLITKLERFTGKELSNEDKRVVKHLRSLTSLGGTAGTEITNEEAGPIDSLFRDIKKYVSNEIEGTEGVAAYETFRNIFRNALYGASLTTSESAAFTAAAGSLRQQAGPVLQKLLVQMEDVRSQLQSVYALNDEQIAQYYLGRSRDQIDDAIEQIDERVELFRDLAAKKERMEETKFSTTPIPRASSDPAQRQQALDKLFGAD
jgi:hypothetical protein